MIIVSTMSKFKKGDTLVPKPDCIGFEKITVFNIDNTMYHCKIMCGTVTIPIHVVDNNYQKL